MMSNLYHESENVISKLRSGEIPKGSIIKVQWPSGNSEQVRFHRWQNGQMVGCNMGWDNLATESYRLSGGVVSLIETPEKDDERLSHDQ